MSTVYQFKIKGYLDHKYSSWFGQLQFDHTAEGNTLLTGRIPDQAAMYGIFGRFRDLGLTLISVNPIVSDDNPGLID